MEVNVPLEQDEFEIDLKDPIYINSFNKYWNEAKITFDGFTKEEKRPAVLKRKDYIAKINLGLFSILKKEFAPILQAKQSNHHEPRNPRIVRASGLPQDGSIEIEEERSGTPSNIVSTDGPSQMTGGLATLFKLLATKKDNFRNDANSVAGTVNDLDAFDDHKEDKTALPPLNLNNKMLMDVITETLTSAREENQSDDSHVSPPQTKRTGNGQTGRSGNPANVMSPQFWDRWEDPVSKESNLEDKNMLKGWGPVNEDNFI
jgi:hypothetical protein